MEAQEPSVDNRPGRSDDDLPEHHGLRVLANRFLFFQVFGS